MFTGCRKRNSILREPASDYPPFKKAPRKCDVRDSGVCSLREENVRDGRFGSMNRVKKYVESSMWYDIRIPGVSLRTHPKVESRAKNDLKLLVNRPGKRCLTQATLASSRNLAQRLHFVPCRLWDFEPIATIRTYSLRVGF